MRATVRSVRPSRLGVRATAIAAVLALSLGACGSDDDDGDAAPEPADTSSGDAGTATDAGTSGGTSGSGGGDLPSNFSVLLPFNPPTFDQWATVAQPLGTILLVNEPLVRYEGSEFEPALAESFETLSPTQYTYTLREGVTFTDGSPLTSEDVKFSFETAMEDTHFSTTYVVMSSIADIQIEGNTITVNLSAPQPQFPYVVAQTGIVSKAFYEANGDEVGTPSVGQIGTGPYLLESFKPEEETVLVANPDYWGEPAVFDSITFTATADDSARMLALQSGEPTGIFEIPIAQVAAVDGLEDYATHEVPDTTLYILQMDVTKPPFDDANVRDAVRHAVNRATVVDAVFGGNGVVASTLTSAAALSSIADPAAVEEALAGFDEQNEYDPELAQSLMAESSVPDGFAVQLPVESYDPNMNLIGQTVIQDLAAIGIEATLQPMGDEYGQTVLLNKDTQGLTLNSFSTNTPDPAMPMGYFTPGDGIFNITGLPNDEAMAKLDESNMLPVDDPERGRLILEALALQQESGAILPLAMPNMYFGLTTDLTLDGFTNYWWMSRWDVRVTTQ